jgi:hypothetical protein
MYSLIYIQLVELKSKKYSVPNKSLGYIEKVDKNGYVDVGWVFSKRPPGKNSTTIYLKDLQVIGEIAVSLPQDQSRC